MKILLINIISVLITVFIQILLFINIKDNISDIVVLKALLTEYVGNAINYGLIFISLINIVTSIILLKNQFKLGKVILFGLLYFIFAIIFYLVLFLLVAKIFLN